MTEQLVCRRGGPSPTRRDGLAGTDIQVLEGSSYEETLIALQAQHPDIIGALRCDRGAMIAMELVQNGDVAQPAAELTRSLVGAAYENG